MPCINDRIWERDTHLPAGWVGVPFAYLPAGWVGVPFALFENQFWNYHFPGIALSVLQELGI